MKSRRVRRTIVALSGADDTSIEVVIDGEPVITEGTTAGVDLSATTAPGQAEAVVTNSYDHPDVPPTTEPTPPEPAEPGADMTTTGAPLLPIVVATLALLLLGLGLTQLRRRNA